MTEREFQNQVVDLAGKCNWRVMHTRPARVRVRGQETFRTPLQGHAGFPDLALAKAGKLIFAECKTNTGKLTLEQLDWQEQLGPSSQRVLVTVWRPKHWDKIERALIHSEWAY